MGHVAFPQAPFVLGTETTSSGYSGAVRTLSWTLTHAPAHIAIRMLTIRASCPSRACTSFPCRLTEIPVPVWPCLLPSCPTSDDPQSLNAAGMQQRAVLLHFNFSPCIVLSCLVLFTSAPPSPSPSSASSSSHALSTISTLWLGTRAAVQCASFSPRALPCQLAILPVLPACPPCLRLALCCTLHRHIWVLCVYSTYCAVSSCRLQEPYCWNHTTRVLYLLT